MCVDGEWDEFGKSDDFAYVAGEREYAFKHVRRFDDAIYRR